MTRLYPSAARGLLALAAVATLAVLAALTGCRKAPSLVPTYQDLLLDPGTRGPKGQKLETTVCADETWQTLTLVRDQRLMADVELRPGARLKLRGCNPTALEAGDGSGNRLRIRLQRRESASEEFVAIPPEAGWWSSEIDLTSTPPGPVTFRLKALLQAPQSILLSELTLAQLEPAPLPAPSQDPRPQILLISIDALRADALASYGGTFKTPNLDRLAREASRWQPHYAAATWTKPSHATMLTGHPPIVAPATNSVLEADVPTLAERFRASGFRTSALVYDCVWLNPKFGLARGFEEYRFKPWRLPRMVDAVTNWVGQHRDQPFFFFFHTFEVHSDFKRLPYESPGVNQQTILRDYGIPDYGCRDGRCASGRLNAILSGQQQALPGEEALLRDLYGKSVEFMDQELGRLFADLKAMGVWDNLLIVFTADHGESLFEQGDLLHSFPWQQVLKVPLLIKWPQGEHAGEERTFPTTSLDLAPTLLQAVGMDASDLPGTNLLTRRRDRPIVIGTQDRVIIQENRKVILATAHHGNLLFDLAKDPKEQVNLAAQHPEQVEELRRLGVDFYKAYRRQRRQTATKATDAPTSTLTEEEAERLKSLGYLGGN